MQVFELDLADGGKISGRFSFPEVTNPSGHTPLMVCMHGGSYDSEYFDVGARPGYGGSKVVPVVGDDDATYAEAQGRYVNDVILPSLWDSFAKRAGATAIVLMAHSIGGMMATIAAGSYSGDDQYPLAGLIVSGIASELVEEPRAAMIQLLANEESFVNFDAQSKDAIMLQWPSKNLVEAEICQYTAELNKPVPREELYDINTTWLKRWEKHAGTVLFSWCTQESIDYQDGMDRTVYIATNSDIQHYGCVNIMDSIMFDAQRHGRVSFYMVSHGEEAVMVGSAAALAPEDVITCQYREHGVFLQRGFELKDFMSQLTANKNDPGKGRNMPVHYSGKSKHAVASTLGTQIPHATGAAYALKMQDLENGAPRRVAAAYFGEGAASEGDFHGALSVAATRNCPVIFICRNNGFAISTPAAQQYRGDGIASRGAGYGIETLRIDGTDIFAVYEATKEARRRALEGNCRPILLELMSYRISHHSTSDDSAAYRKGEEVALWKSEKRNPVARLRRWLEREGLWDEDKDKAAKDEIRADIIRNLTSAEKEKKPALHAIFSDVYAKLTEEVEEQRAELRRLMEKYPQEYDCDQHEGGIQGL
ncbi:hypothetical protein TrVFT333_007746 [Trichoderma virens FT-333]|nr:hypothetical protein TrVFT333_007746 [Trichoderma virens FT-333]